MEIFLAPTALTGKQRNAFSYSNNNFCQILTRNEKWAHIFYLVKHSNIKLHKKPFSCSRVTVMRTNGANVTSAPEGSEAA
jgi:hypothetical protein